MHMGNLIKEIASLLFEDADDNFAYLHLNESAFLEEEASQILSISKLNKSVIELSSINKDFKHELRRIQSKSRSCRTATAALKQRRNDNS